MSENFSGLSNSNEDNNRSRLVKLSKITANISQAIEVLTQSGISQENRLNDHEHRLQNTEILVASLSDKERDSRKIREYMSVKALKNLLQVDWEVSRTGEIGKELSSLCRKHNVERGSVFDANFGTVKTYPPFILRLWLEQNRYYVPRELRGSYE